MVRTYEVKITPQTERALTIDATLDPNVTVLVTCGTVARVEITGVRSHVSIQVTLVILVDRARNRWPRVSQDK